MRARHGYDVGSEIKYVALANEIAKSRTLTTTIALLGFLIVAISMAGLANALTTSVLERRREIGILRSIGARARDIRRIFASETLALALAGWLIAIPLGYLLDRFLVWLVKKVANVEIPFAFPFWYLALALAGTILLALLVTLLPISRAVHVRPGEALRYAIGRSCVVLSFVYLALCRLLAGRALCAGRSARRSSRFSCSGMSLRSCVGGARFI